MKRKVRGWAELTVRNVACLAFGAALAGCASDPRPVVVGQPITLPSINDYCAAAQKEIANSRVPARNVIVTRTVTPDPALMGRSISRWVTPWIWSAMKPLGFVR